MDRIHVGRLAIEVNRQDGLGARRERGLEPATSIVKERGSMSTKTGRAPVYSIAATVATKVNGTVTTSSPGPTPAASSARWSALDPLLTPMACPTPQAAANSASKANTSSPSTYWPEASTPSTAASMSSLIEWYCAFKSTSGIMPLPSGASSKSFPHYPASSWWLPR